MLAFLAAAGFVPPRGPWVKLERPQRERPSGRARTNELDAGKRWPMIGGEEEPAGLWLPGRGVSLGGSPGAVRRSGLTSTHSAACQVAGP